MFALRISPFSRPVRRVFVSRQGCTVVIAGWAASTARILDKYARLYENEGIETQIIPVGIPRLWFSPFGKAAAYKTLEKIPSNEEVIFHIFSGSSTAILPYLLDCITNNKRNLKLVGTVFDSCPVEFSSKSGLAAVKILVEQNHMNPIVAKGINIAGRTVDWLIGQSINERARLSWMNKELGRVPHLYIYSRNDVVVSVDFIQFWIEKQKERNVDVTSHLWDESAHVRHFQKNPELYKKQIGDFIEKMNISAR